MDWTQTLTIILTIIGSMLAVWYAFYHIIKEDINLAREDTKRQDEQFAKRDERFDEEFSKAHALWASLLQKIHDVDTKFYTLEKQIYEIKLDQSRKA
jgi:hypothetical protein